MNKTLISLGLGAICASLLSVNSEAARPEPQEQRQYKASKLNSNLSLVMHAGEANAQRTANIDMKPMMSMMKGAGVMLTDTFIAVDMAAEDVESLKQDLVAMGAKNIESFAYTISAMVPMKKLEKLAQMQSLRFASASQMAKSATAGIVQSQADAALQADIARQDFGLTGAGIRIGVLSDSFGCNPPGNPTSTAEQDIASGEISSDLIILEDLPCDPANPASDEGRAMMQLINDIAPEAPLAFHTAFTGVAAFANGILELANDAGSDIIVDDIIYFAEPMFQDGPIAQAAGMVKDLGVPYFSAAGNNARGSYESEFRQLEDEEGRIFHDFDPTDGSSDFVGVRLSASRGVETFGSVSFQWDEPNFSVSGAPGSPSDVDFLLFDQNGDFVPACEPLGADGVDPTPLCTIGMFTPNLGGDAIEVITVRSTVGTVDLEAVVEVFEGPAPSRIKMVSFGNLSIEPSQTGASTVYGHSNGPGVLSIGAAPYISSAAFGDPIFNGRCLPACLESFSSAGGLEILFDTDGNRLSAPLDRMKPDVVGPDGVSTSFFGQQGGFDDDGFPNFFGTSAAAPNVAAVAALMIEANSGGYIKTNNGDELRVCIAERSNWLVDKLAAENLLRNSRFVRRGFCLSPDRIYSVLEETALDMSSRVISFGTATIETVENPEGFDYDSGHGYVDGLRAIRSVSKW